MERTPRIEVPEDRGYQIKEALLGKALTNDAVEDEKLSKTLALGVLSSDCISSSAYGSEMMLLVMLPLFGMAAYDVLLPLTAVVLAVLVVVTMTYRQVVMIYTRAGGSYVVARENFGPVVAQVAAVALMLDYIVTVAVQAAAGTNALTSALPNLGDYSLEITVAVVAVLAYGNLRGLREAGRAFAFPTYFFVGSMALVLVMGVYHELTGDLPMYDPLTAEGAFPVGGGGTLLSIGGLYVVLKAFANGGSSLTGLEAISNGVSVFHSPAGRNARRTLVVMSTILGVLVGGVSWLAHLTHAVPYESGSPTVISQVARAVLPDNTVGHALFFMVQLATMLILYTGANTPFTGFPYLANFVAGDGFLPRWLRKRGHRLAFSNGILLLTVVALALLIGTGAHVDKLVAFYAIGVFTGFTLAGFGMAAYHRTHRGPRSRWSVLLNGVSGSVAAGVVIVFAVTKFTEGAWLVVVVFPVMVIGLLRLHRAYQREEAALADIPTSGRRRGISGLNVVLVLVDNVDLAVLSALRYARGLRPQHLHSVHFVVDSAYAADLQKQWDSQDGTDLALELIDCPDRRIDRAAVQLTYRLVRDNPLAQVTVLLPRRAYGTLATRLLHDRTADRIARAVSRVPGAAATIVPFDASAAATARAAANEAAMAATASVGSTAYAPATDGGADGESAATEALPAPDAGQVGIGAAATRQVVTVTGRIVSRKLSAIANAPSVTYRVADQTGEVTLLFYGRRDVAGLAPGTTLEITGRIAPLHGQATMSNPQYRILA
ncbi:MAG: amino acid permease [Actinomycetales bacterium]|nr:amino acid permease [Actinomycetales bacterium]